jgi:hypothetical protein
MKNCRIGDVRVKFKKFKEGLTHRHRSRGVEREEREESG